MEMIILFYLSRMYKYASKYFMIKNDEKLSFEIEGEDMSFIKVIERS